MKLTDFYDEKRMSVYRKRSTESLRKTGWKPRVAKKFSYCQKCGLEVNEGELLEIYDEIRDLKLNYCASCHDKTKL